MVTEDPQRARTSSGPRGTAPTARAPAAGESGDSAVDLAEVERAVRELLGRYRIALEFASDMPMLGRSRMSRGRPRWGSRFFTRVYVETHVRKQLKAIRECLRLTRLRARR